MKISKNIYHQLDYLLLFTIFLILIIGLFTLTSTSSVMSYQKFNNSYYYLKHQIFNGVIPGLLVFFISAFISLNFLRKISLILFLLGLFFLVAVFIPGWGVKYQEATRWVNLKFFSFQPIEPFKLVLILFLAAFFDRQKEKIGDFSTTVLPLIFIVGLPIFLIILQPNFSAVFLIFFITLTIAFVAGAKILHLFSLVSAAGITFLLSINFFPHLANRLLIYFYPQTEIQGLGYHLHQALIAIGSGGLFGLGLGRSGQKFFYLPESFRDSIFAVLAEELGFLVTTFILFLFSVIVWRGLKIAKNASDYFSQLVAVGITSWLCFQIIINVGANLGLLPLTGLPLPLFSYGSSALVSNLAALGVLINISRQTKSKKYLIFKR